MRTSRRRLGLTQEELGANAGLSIRTIRKIEAGQIGSPRPATVRLLAEAFGLTGTDRVRFCQTAAGTATDQPTWLVPRQLPAPPQLFTGRTEELASLDHAGDGSIVVVTTIDGMAGIGKTALAIHAAHRIADRYPDGQLFLDLHGYTHGVAPVEPAEALDHLSRALDVPGSQIPASLDERAALYRSRVADQRMLIVLDNAATEAQVAPLLPGAPGCLVLVTSRRRLAGLDHTHTLSLDTLPVPDAVTLFVQTAGEHRLAGQPPELLVELVELCGQLPLAIRIAAARLRSHLSWSLAHLVQRLRDQPHRLGELEAGQRTVTAALDLSYRHLDPDQQRTYRLLGLHPGPDIDPYATAALLDSTLQHAARMLDRLLDAHLLQEPVAGRYRFHDLTRTHAAHTATRDETVPAGTAALDRLFDYYRHTASAAMDAAYPYEQERRPPVPPAHTPSPDLGDPASALGWLDTELPNLLAAAGHATEHSRPAHILHLSTTLHRHLRTRGRYHDAETLHHQALTIARVTGHQAVELETLTGLGHIHRLQDRHEQAADHYSQALQLARTTGNQAGELNALAGLGWAHWWRGRYERAIDYYQQTLQIARTTGNQAGELNALAGMGWVSWRQDRYEQAADYLGQVLRIARVTGNQPGELNALAGLGQFSLRRGRHEQATDHFQQLLDLAQKTGDRNCEFEARQGLGRLQRSTGHPDAAITHHDQALALADDLGQPVDQARAHDGLAHAHHASHQHDQARRHWQHALDILTSLGIDHTDDEETTTEAIRTHLATLAERYQGAPGAARG